MKHIKSLWLGFFLVITGLAASGQPVRGLVLEESSKGVFKPLPYASVYWLGTSHATSTDSNGMFSIARDSFSQRLVISYTGYISDTILVSNNNSVRIVLAAGKTLQEVEIHDVQGSLTYSSTDPIKSQNISEKELFKAACCNLSESFETNPSVDVAISDAVTGIRQIQMLGLSGNYTQITLENMSLTRGLSSQYGLTFIPGPWIEGMQLSKGTGSVVNGRESITGQINVELKKPENTDRLYVNGYQNNMGRSELNLITAIPLNKSRKWNTALFAHASQTWMKNDFNGDGFLEIPLGYQVNLLNRWKYDNGKGFMMQFAVHGLRDEKVSGQKEFDASKHRLDSQVYGTGINAERISAWSKIGYVFPQKKYQSIGLIMNAISYRQDAYFGVRQYEGRERSMNASLIYQSILGTTAHKYRVGVNALYDEFDEYYNGPIDDNYKFFYPGDSFARTEKEFGIFSEYTWSPNARFDLVTGLRVDFHNLFTSFITPRIHIRYAIDENTVLRASWGSGSRITNVFTENMGNLVSSRTIALPSDFPPDQHKGFYYGKIMPETALNSGINLTRDFKLNYRKGQIHIDYYRTVFARQVVAWLETPGLIEVKNERTYSFFGYDNYRPFSNAIQAEVNYEPVRRMELRIAYRWLDVKLPGRIERPLISRNRVFTNLAYTSRKKWKYDLTVTWNGRKRLPATTVNPEEFRMPEYSPSYFLVNAQISKTFGKNLDAYLGVENLFGFRQEKLILSAEDPFGKYFDASYVWGPSVGRMIYVGFRWKLK